MDKFQSNKFYILNHKKKLMTPIEIHNRCDCYHFRKKKSKQIFIQWAVIFFFFFQEKIQIQWILYRIWFSIQKSIDNNTNMEIMSEKYNTNGIKACNANQMFDEWTNVVGLIIGEKRFSQVFQIFYSFFLY